MPRGRVHGAEPVPSSLEPTIVNLATPSHSIKRVLSGDSSGTHISIGVGSFRALKTAR